MKQQAMMKSRAARVWFRLSEMYGKGWANNYGDQPSAAWTIRIGELSNAQIARGLEALSITDETFYPVPDLAKFTAYCARGADRAEHFCPWPQFDGEPVGIPKMTDAQKQLYRAGQYDNVQLHREWIAAQPFYSRNASPEVSVLELLDLARKDDE